MMQAWMIGILLNEEQIVILILGGSIFPYSHLLRSCSLINEAKVAELALIVIFCTKEVAKLVPSHHSSSVP